MRATYRLTLNVWALSVLLCVVPAANRVQTALSAEEDLSAGSSYPRNPPTDRFQLSANAMQTAQIIGVEDLIGKIFLRTAAKDMNAPAQLSLDEMLLRQQIMEAVVIASFDVEDVLNRIDDARAQVIELRDILRANRDRAAGTTNVATLAIGTGLGVVSGVLQFSDSTKGTGNIIGFAAGGLSTLLAFHSLRQQRNAKRPAWILPDMLSPFFSESLEQPACYPKAVWAYLNRAAPGTASQPSRRERIQEEWRKAGHFPSPDSLKGKAKIALLTDTNAANKKLSIDLLSERSVMLADIRNELSLMKHDLHALLGAVRISR